MHWAWSCINSTGRTSVNPPVSVHKKKNILIWPYLSLKKWNKTTEVRDLVWRLLSPLNNRTRSRRVKAACTCSSIPGWETEERKKERITNGWKSIARWWAGFPPDTALRITLPGSSWFPLPKGGRPPASFSFRRVVVVGGSSVVASAERPSPTATTIEPNTRGTAPSTTPAGGVADRLATESGTASASGPIWRPWTAIEPTSPNPSDLQLKSQLFCCLSLI